VWKSLPGWIVLNRRHAAEILALTKLLGGWGEPAVDVGVIGSRADGAAGSNSALGGSATGTGAVYRGTQGRLWRADTVLKLFDTSTSAAAPASADKAFTVENENSARNGTVQSMPGGQSTDGDVVGSSIVACEDSAPNTVVVDGQPPNSSGGQLPSVTSDAALLDAWATVHAPEEVFFATALALLGYLRDPTPSPGTSQANGNGQEVRIAAVNFAEWARRSDAHPIQYFHFDADLVRGMTATGALFGRKFAPGCVSVEQWRRALEQVRGGGEPADTGRSEAFPAGASGAASNGYQQQQRRHNNDGSRRRDPPHRATYAEYGGNCGYSNRDRDRYGDEDRQCSYHDRAYYDNHDGRDRGNSGGGYDAHTDRPPQGSHYSGRVDARYKSHGRREEYRGSGAGYGQPHKRHRYSPVSMEES
jgi:hypothetical protein